MLNFPYSHVQTVRGSVSVCPGFSGHDVEANAVIVTDNQPIKLRSDTVMRAVPGLLVGLPGPSGTEQLIIKHHSVTRNIQLIFKIGGGGVMGAKYNYEIINANFSL